MSKENLLWDIEMALRDKTFKNGLSSYTQANCQVTLTDNGLRIYRPPNLTVEANGNTMWGGLRLQFINKLQEGHTYIIMFDVKGQSHNSISNIGFTNNMGWGGGGLEPKPSNVKNNAHTGVSLTSNGKLFYYKFTINDALYKTCTTSYSSFVKDTVYPSYRDFQFGFGYNSTGALGTDIYINNIRMYDITEEENTGLYKSGNLDFLNIEENNLGETKIYFNDILYTNEIIEI